MSPHWNMEWQYTCVICKGKASTIMHTGISKQLTVPVGIMIILHTPPLSLRHDGINVLSYQIQSGELLKQSWTIRQNTLWQEIM